MDVRVRPEKKEVVKPIKRGFLGRAGGREVWDGLYIARLRK